MTTHKLDDLVIQHHDAPPQKAKSIASNPLSARRPPGHAYVPNNMGHHLDSLNTDEIADVVSGCVLLVEDDDEVATLVTEMLLQLGWNVTRAAGAKGALGALANEREVDLVLSDIMMPGSMNGVDLAREIKKRRPRLPIILTSGFAEAAAADAEAIGIGILSKPYRLEDLQRRLSAALASTE